MERLAEQISQLDGETSSLGQSSVGEIPCPTCKFFVQSSYEIFMVEVKLIATESLSLPNDR